MFSGSGFGGGDMVLGVLDTAVVGGESGNGLVENMGEIIYTLLVFLSGRSEGSCWWILARVCCGRRVINTVIFF